MVTTTTVHKGGYCRSGYKRKSFIRNGHRIPSTHVSGACVEPTTFKIEKVGQPTRSKVRIPVIGTLAGYHVDLADRTRHTILRRLVQHYGAALVWRKLHSQVNLRSKAELDPDKARAHSRVHAREIFRADRDWIKSNFDISKLTPKAAIKKWSGMSHKARVAARS